MKKLALLIVLLIFVPQLRAQGETPSQPNIIIIMADDLGYGDLGSYDGVQLTPNLDKLAKEGMRFTDFHSSGTVCSPTRAGLITGRYQQKSGVDGVINADPKHPAYKLGVDPQTQVTYPMLVKKQGYKTALLGKWHVGYLNKYHPMNFGFDRFVGFLSGNIDYISHYDRMENYDWWHDKKQVVEEGYSTQLITKHAVDFITENKETPFVLYVAHEAVHSPVQGPNSLIQRGPNKQKSDEDEDKTETYKTVIGELDRSVGEILAKVKSLGLSEKTMILFTSDNGPMELSSAGALRGKKGSVFEGGHRVPAIAWWPGVIKENSVNDQLAITLDIMPTIVSLTKAKLPKGHELDGVNLLPSLLGQKNGHRELFWRPGGLDEFSTSLLTVDRPKAMRSGQWKLIVDPYYKKIRLYDLSKDISELKNIARQHPKIVNEMTNKVKAWEQEVLPYLPYKIKPKI